MRRTTAAAAAFVPGVSCLGTLCTLGTVPATVLFRTLETALDAALIGVQASANLLRSGCPNFLQNINFPDGLTALAHLLVLCLFEGSGIDRFVRKLHPALTCPRHA